MSEQYKALQGFRDILPDEQPYWRYVEEVASSVAQLYGYRRIETPLFVSMQQNSRTMKHMETTHGTGHGQ